MMDVKYNRYNKANKIMIIKGMVDRDRVWIQADNCVLEVQRHHGVLTVSVINENPRSNPDHKSIWVSGAFEEQPD